MRHLFPTSSRQRPAKFGRLRRRSIRVYDYVGYGNVFQGIDNGCPCESGNVGCHIEAVEVFLVTTFLLIRGFDA